MTWTKGRLGTGYDKIRLMQSMYPVPFDVYLLRFKEGSRIPPHKDEVPSGKHYRLNLIIKKAKDGGVFKCSNTILNTGRAILFRPDIEEHSVSRVRKGTRYVLSIGVKIGNT